MNSIIINKEYITLIQFLKLTNYISSGGEISFFMENSDILINDVAPFEKRKKIYDSYIVKINDDVYKVKSEVK